MDHVSAKEHYDKHLGDFYSWMAGDFAEKASEFKRFLLDNSIEPNTTKIAIDLGAGHGIQSIPLAELGFKVTAVDFNEPLLHELQSNAGRLSITIRNDDIRNVRHFGSEAELIVCCGDTLSHLENRQEIETFFADLSHSLKTNGKLVLSFRDYSIALTGTDRFIPVKSDDNRILTCILDYERDFVNVTDLLYEGTDIGWIQKVSTYRKIRLVPSDITKLLQSTGLVVTFNQKVSGLATIIATKP